MWYNINALKQWLSYVEMRNYTSSLPYSMFYIYLGLTYSDLPFSRFTMSFSPKKPGNSGFRLYLPNTASCRKIISVTDCFRLNLRNTKARNPLPIIPNRQYTIPERKDLISGIERVENWEILKSWDSLENFELKTQRKVSELKTLRELQIERFKLSDSI